MEAEKTKSYKEMDKLFNEFASHDNTLLALWKIGEQGGVAFTGDEFDVSRAFYEILKNGLQSRKENTEFKLMSSLMFGIKMLVSEKSAESIAFMGILNKIYDSVINDTVKKMSKKYKIDEDALDDLIDALSEVTKKCDVMLRGDDDNDDEEEKKKKKEKSRKKK